MNLLDMIDFPSNLRDLDERELQRLVDEVREFVIESVSSTGGHLASNLGVVELSVALHYVFDTPQDRLVWDVGHQCYPHKILTGRKAAMASVRKVGGMAGFPAREESPYDAFGVGHAGTSISAAVGMALGLRGRDARVVAVIGDGSLSAGMAYEALNHAGSCETLPLTIVLNDNRMSISPAVGGLNDHLEALVTRWRDEANVPISTLFETLGLDYVGPIDGHDMANLLATLRDAKTRNRPHVIHVVTKKGKGYRPAELDPVAYHGPSPFKPDTGLVRKKGGKLTYSQVFGQWLCDAAATDERILRYPRATTGSEVIEQTKETLPLGRGMVCRVSGKRDSARVAFLAFGPLLSVAMEVAREIDATVVDMRFVKPLDEDLLLTVANEHEVIVTIEEGTVLGGAGAACAERIAAEGWAVRMLRLGLPDAFVPHGDRAELLRLNGLGVSGVREAVLAFTEAVDLLDPVE
ncbi:1-deoxy-D-xylulose-5-phosphate synthase N-terminal domain-containing protein [Paraburkholderia sp. BR10872]|uniref:1-deoxy-D-xylulose-5-phosphate synthase N-terminal domain-containing protein n=1 Tax=Paraburkholderia sp. BR10872 TaxID=3236989 RepID=UPI0034D24FF2